MNLSDLGKQAGKVESIVIDAPYTPDPLNAYSKIAGQHSILLESAEINSKDNLKSLLIVDAAVRIECNGNKVSVRALSNNGSALLPLLREHLGSYLLAQAPDSQEMASQELALEFAFPPPDPNLDEDARLKQASVFDVLRSVKNKLVALRNHPHAVFLGGVFAYDLLASFEPLPPVNEGKNTCPDYVFYVAETLVLVDHQSKSTQILGSVFSGEHVAEAYFAVSQRLEIVKQALIQLSDNEQAFDNTLLPVSNDNTVQENKNDTQYCQDVITLKENILDGDIFQVVPSRTFSLSCTKPLLAYQQLKLNNPSPYMFYMSDAQFIIFGASPESALKYDAASNLLEVYPIAGTRPRGKRADGSIDVDLDSRLELDLQQDEKERSEHIMLVDLARNDVARVSKPGSRFVKDLLKVDRYSHVMHLVSRVVGSLRDDLDALHAYQACMNMGTLVGAPKISAASLIRHCERERRGSYGGAVGYFNGKGDFDTCIVIRSAFVKDGQAHIQAGAGIVNDSVPQSEADETRAKAQAVISAVKRSHHVLSDEMVEATNAKQETQL